MFIGTDLEYVKVTIALPDGEVYALNTVRKHIDFWKENRFVTEIVSLETGEVFYHT